MPSIAMRQRLSSREETGRVRIAGASAVPLLVYAIPCRTGVEISRVTLLTLAGDPRIRAIKDCRPMNCVLPMTRPSSTLRERLRWIRNELNRR